MKTPTVGINPRVLVWARETSGHSVEDVASAMKRPVEIVQAWEAGDDAPTYPQLERLAYTVLKRPLAVFFFPAPPEEPTVEGSFRTLPEFEIERLSSDTRLKIRDAHAMQLSLFELCDGVNPSPRKIFCEISIDVSTEISSAASAVREYLGVTTDLQVGEWISNEDALKGWRSAIEESGIFVFKNSFKQQDISGFCLHDDEFPLIYVNNSTAKSRQIFTLAHELSHLLLKTSSITIENDRLINSLEGANRDIEIYCNKFAAELVIPMTDFLSVLGDLPKNEETAETIAGEFNVSREVVFRRFLDLGHISREQYQQQVSRWNREFLSSAPSSSGGNYYNTQASYLGDRYLGLAFGSYYDGKISKQQLAQHLKIAVRNLVGMEQTLLRNLS